MIQRFDVAHFSPSHSRREFCGLFSGATIGFAAAPALILSALPAVAQTTPTRMDLNTFLTDPQRVQSLINGVATMRVRAPSDPTSWFFQAAIHGVSPEAIAEAEAIDPDVTQVDQANHWNQCPHFGQTSANFLPWHRAYLHYFESILRSASGDPDFALPYWNYDDPAQLFFPRIFGVPVLDQAGTPNPLFHESRDAAFQAGVFQLNANAFDNSALFQETQFFGPSDTEGIAGGVSDNNGRTQGRIEAGIHNLIHFAVGGAIAEETGAMASVTTAAFDPIFWVHHATVDKYWIDWMCLPNRDWGLLPDQAWLDDRPWVFFDETGTMQMPSRAEMMDHRDLGYTYDNQAPNCSPLQLPDPSLIASVDEGASTEFVTSERAVELTIRTEPVNISLAEVDLGPNLAAVPNKAFYLEVTGLVSNNAPQQRYDIYLADAETGPLVRTSAAYLGTLALFGAEHHSTSDGADHSNSGVRFPIARALEALNDPSTTELVVQPVPLLQLSQSPIATPIDPEFFGSTRSHRQQCPNFGHPHTHI